ncbi:RagB/SusD family nutrient uptake outer membrane protein [Capnocytophaga canis]|uniref:RagB/SusD family nutrient uptake outer membrane protein n=1 Tax=Capnocytophaga canis TaxID=1848903 RepID=UPI00385B55B7
MKNILKIILLTTTFIAVGCSDEFFEKTPQGSLDPSKIDETLLVGFRNSIYGYKGGMSLNGYSAIFLDGYADNGYSRNSWDSNGASVQANTLTTAQNYGYGWFYNGIRACNQVIEKIDDFQKVSESIRSKYKNEARVMRAWLYGGLTLYFGDVPFVPNLTNDFPEGIARTSSTQIREWVLKELDEAIEVLPVSNDKGTFNKAVAYAIKARMAYYFGKYDQAEVAARYVIDNGGYRLHEVASLSEDMKKDGEYFKKFIDFSAYGVSEETFIKGIFNYQNIWKADYSPETIIAQELIANEQEGTWLRVTALLTPNLVNKQAWATIVPIQELVDAYWTTDGKTQPTLPTMDERITKYNELKAEINSIKPNMPKKTYSEAVHSIVNDLPSRDYMLQYKNRDSRLYASIIFPFSAVNRFLPDQYQEYIPDIVNYGRSGFAFRKMTGADDVISAYGGGYFVTGVDFPMMRLAEMLLIYAESRTQNAGYDATVRTELNKLRKRAGMPNVPETLSKTEALDFIRSERRIELAGEGFRFFDIRLYEDDKRNGGYKGSQAASVVMKGQIRDVVGNPGAKKTWTPRLMYMPIPATVIDKNPLMKQNEGY